MVTPLTSSNGNGTHPQVVQQLRPLPPPGTDPALSRYLDHMWDSVYQLLDLHVQNRSAISANVPATMQEIEKALEAQGSNPLNVTALRGQLGESQIAGAPSLTALPALSDQSYDDGALVAVSGVVYRRNRTTDPGSWDSITNAGSITSVSQNNSVSGLTMSISTPTTTPVINLSGVPNIAASNVTSGQLNTARLPDTINIATAYQIAGTQVVSARGAAVADATGAGDVVAQLNSLLARIRAHGLIAP